MPKDTPFEREPAPSLLEALLPTLVPPVNLAEIDTLHELLALALDDFEKVLSDPAYMVDMDRWHHPGKYRCHVCLAGSVMAKTLGAHPQVRLNGPEFPSAIWTRLDVLDTLRCGAIDNAVDTLGGDPETAAVRSLAGKWSYRIEDRITWARGHEAGRALLAALREMQADLKEAGL